MRSSSHVHYGCGLAAPAEWTNFDTNPTLRLERLPFIGRVAPVAEGSFRRMSSSATSLRACRCLRTAARRSTAPMCLSNADAAGCFMTETGLGIVDRRRGVGAVCCALGWATAGICGRGISTRCATSCSRWASSVSAKRASGFGGLDVRSGTGVAMGRRGGHPVLRRCRARSK
jgi:hypothetical protein